jgi:inner membrane protein involved in colicin E2 resistance
MGLFFAGDEVTQSRMLSKQLAICIILVIITSLVIYYLLPNTPDNIHFVQLAQLGFDVILFYVVMEGWFCS